MSPRRAGAAVLLVLVLAGCSESAAPGNAYHPAELTQVAGSDLTQVTLTDDAAGRIGLEMATATAKGSQVLVPYAALIYDGQGAAWVYVKSAGLSFSRQAVTVTRIKGDVVHVAKGIRAGDRVATTGATEIYGAELGIDGSH